MTIWLRQLSALVLLALTTTAALAKPKEFTNWPEGTSPQVVGKKVAERFVSTIDLSKESQVYPAICAWFGALKFANATNDEKLKLTLIERFDAQLTPEISKTIFEKRHVDYSMAGSVPLEIYVETGYKKHLSLGRHLADQQWENPTPEGLTPETRFWIDDMYMITVLQVQAYRATLEDKYLDRAALEMEAYLNKLQQPNGLFYHAPDVPFFWGRGNGWVAAGLTELLRVLPKDHPRHARILSGYQKMMKTLLAHQGENGLWRQLIDRKELWPETSSTAMFTYAIVTGVKNGWLKDKSYARAARNGWLGLVRYLEPNGDLREVCEGTGKHNDYQYYVDRKRITGDLHGQAPLLWAAAALTSER